MIVVLYTVCWLPYCVYEGAIRLLTNLKIIYLNTEYSKTAQLLYLLAMINSLSDPFVYALRMRKVQRGW